MLIIEVIHRVHLFQIIVEIVNNINGEMRHHALNKEPASSIGSKDAVTLPHIQAH